MAGAAQSAARITRTPPDGANVTPRRTTRTVWRVSNRRLTRDNTRASTIYHRTSSIFETGTRTPKIKRPQRSGGFPATLSGSVEEEGDKNVPPPTATGMSPLHWEPSGRNSTWMGAGIATEETEAEPRLSTTADLARECGRRGGQECPPSSGAAAFQPPTAGSAVERRLSAAVPRGD